MYENHVGRSLSCCSEDELEVLCPSYVRDSHTKLREVLQCQAVQALIHHGAQFEVHLTSGVRRAVYIRQSTIELPCSSDDSGGGVQDALQQLVSRSSRRVREQCVAVIYPIGDERDDYSVALHFHG